MEYEPVSSNCGRLEYSLSGAVLQSTFVASFNNNLSSVDLDRFLTVV